MLQTILLINVLAWTLMVTVFHPLKHPADRWALARDWTHWLVIGLSLAGLFLLRRNVVKHVLRNGWREAKRLGNYEIGVTVPSQMRVHPVVGGLVGGLAGVLGPALYLGPVILGAHLPIRLQPLAGALGVALFSTLCWCLLWF